VEELDWTVVNLVSRLWRSVQPSDIERPSVSSLLKPAQEQ